MFNQGNANFTDLNVYLIHNYAHNVCKKQIEKACINEEKYFISVLCVITVLENKLHDQCIAQHYSL